MISVVVIGRNEAARIGACLESIRTSLGVLSHEILYVDSRSTDDSVAIAKTHGARCFILKDQNTTAGLGRLVGAKEAKGEYILFLDGDMQLEKGFCEKAMMAMAQRSYDGCSGIRKDVYMKDGQVAGTNDNYFGCTAERIVPEFGGAVFLKKEALERAGGWSADTIACEESELHARLIASGAKIAELPVPMIVHTDAVRDGRGVMGTLFSRRRLGEGQAMRCAMALGQANAYIEHEKEKFLLYSVDWMCVILILVLGVWGFLGALFFQTMQIGLFLSKRRLRAFVSQKLFFFAFPAGMITYHVRSRDYIQA